MTYQIKEARKQKYKISEEEQIELDMLLIDLKADLEIAANYSQKAENALKTYDENLASYSKDQTTKANVKAVAVGVGVGVGVAVATGEEIKNLLLTPPPQVD